MSYFKNMILQKTPILILALLMYILALFQNTNSIELPDITFVIKKIENDVEPICIADGNALNVAIGWIYPIPPTDRDVPQVDNYFEPNIKSEYTCNFSKGKHCTDTWSLQMSNWELSKSTTNNFEPTLDTRWEDFPIVLTSNNTKEFLNRMEIPHMFKMGISVRISQNAEIFICEGWDPNNHPCYYINIGSTDNKHVYLRKYKSVPEKMLKTDPKIDSFKSDVGILSKQEWKNFELTLRKNGTLTLKELHKNLLLLNYTDKTPLRPIFLFLQSKSAGLWKIHNNQYLFTKLPMTTQFGPDIAVYGSQICISLYISLCKNCMITFFTENGSERNIIKHIAFENNGINVEWKKTTLEIKEILENYLKVYIETKFIHESKKEDGFWKIDDVRICNKDEIKVTKLINGITPTDIDKSLISCQSLNNPTWRPKLYIHDINNKSAELGKFKETSTGIHFTWNTKDTEDFQPYYITHYQGRDTCKIPNDQSNRKKSQGYIISRKRQIDIEDLIPYTQYNITFWNVIENKKWPNEISTLPTEAPTKGELPWNITMKITDTANNITWQTPQCTERYGPLMYEVQIMGKSIQNTQSLQNIFPEFFFNNLIPFNNYTAAILTARGVPDSTSNITWIKVVQNFTTLSGVATKVQNLELYSTNSTSASFRYDLPEILNGIPQYVKVEYCHPLYIAGCHSDIHNLTKCKLWKQKYCVQVTDLIRNYNYIFNISIKNAHTYKFGEPTVIVATTKDKVPGKPTNITFKMIECHRSLDYCHINISWIHPYYQNGSITMFDIILNETSSSSKADTTKTIHEVLGISNGSYEQQYTYTVKYIPYNTHYTIAIRAENDHEKGDYATVDIQTDDIGNYIDQTPTLVDITDETLTFTLPKLDWRLRSSTVLIIVQDSDVTVSSKHSLIQLENVLQLCNPYGNVWPAKEIKVYNNTESTITVGDGTSGWSELLDKRIINTALNPNTEYCVTFLIINKYKNTQNTAVYHETNIFTNPASNKTSTEKTFSTDTNQTSTYIFPILVLLILAVIGGWILFRYYRDKKWIWNTRRKNGNDNSEHIYETMPFEDYTVDSVSNQTYDKLEHT